MAGSPQAPKRSLVAYRAEAASIVSDHFLIEKIIRFCKMAIVSKGSEEKGFTMRIVESKEVRSQ